MAPLTKKRRRAFGGEDLREQAVQRLRAEHGARTKMQKFRSKEPISHDRPESQIVAARKMKRGPDNSAQELRNRPRQFSTTRGLRRLSYKEAFSRRTTESSRNRVMALYGRTAPPKGYADRRLHKPVPNTTGAPLRRPGGPAGSFSRGTGTKGDYGAGLDTVARMRTGTSRRRRQLPTFGSPRAGRNSRRKYF